MKELKIVQFAHPGGEHSITKSEIKTGIKQWNYGRHQRKFMCAKGQYAQVDGTVSEKQDLLFWGEWEPSSLILKVSKAQGIGVLPKWVHYPQIELDSNGHVTAPYHNGKTVSIKMKCNGKDIKQTVKCCRQNTDPFVFGDAFYYSCCKQRKKEKDKCSYAKTKMCFLEKGSIILFGSSVKTAKGESYFVVDTVFVVNESKPFSIKNYTSDLKGFIPKDYDQIMGYKCWGPTDEFVCYRGATLKSLVNGMFSFVPCRTCNDGITGFPRMKLTQNMLSLIQDKLNAAPKFTPKNGNATLENVKQVWDLLCNIAAKQGFKLGVSFNYKKVTK